MAVILEGGCISETRVMEGVTVDFTGCEILGGDKRSSRETIEEGRIWRGELRERVGRLAREKGERWEVGTGECRQRIGVRGDDTSKGYPLVEWRLGVNAALIGG